MRGVILGAALAVWAAAAAAQEGPEWEAQRCVWRCLESFGPASNPAYHACVEDRCSIPDPAPPAAAVAVPGPVTPWTWGAVADGSGAFAGVADPSGQSSFYYMCGRQGQSLFQLVGPEGPGGMLSLVVDGLSFPTVFGSDGGRAAVAAAPPGTAVLAAMMGGRVIEIVNPAGYSIGRFGLAGSRQAINAALALCR